jgi:hypothetical protein
MTFNIVFNSFLFVLFNLLGHEVESFCRSTRYSTRIFLRKLNRLSTKLRSWSKSTLFGVFKSFEMAGIPIMDRIKPTSSLSESEHNLRRFLISSEGLHLVSQLNIDRLVKPFSVISFLTEVGLLTLQELSQCSLFRLTLVISTPRSITAQIFIIHSPSLLIYISIARYGCFTGRNLFGINHRHLYSSVWHFSSIGDSLFSGHITDRRHISSIVVWSRGVLNFTAWVSWAT